MRLGYSWKGDGGEKILVLLKKKTDDGFVVIEGLDEALNPVETKMDFFKAIKPQDMPDIWKRSNVEVDAWVMGNNPAYANKNGVLILGRRRAIKDPQLKKYKVKPKEDSIYRFVITKSKMTEHLIEEIGDEPQPITLFLGTISGKILDPYDDVIPIPEEFKIV